MCKNLNTNLVIWRLNENIVPYHKYKLLLNPWITFIGVKLLITLLETPALK